MKDKFTILIQGPLNEDSLQNIPNYLKFGKEVIVSHWDSDDLSLIQKYQQDNVYFINQKFPGKNIPNGCEKHSTFYWAVRSTGLGISICQTDYIIKTRSDEYFSNLQPLIDKLLQNENKLICANILFKKWSTRPYHIGDHLFAARADLLKGTYKTLFNAYAQITVNSAFQQTSLWVAEQILASAFLYQHGILLQPKSDVKPNQTIDHGTKIMEKYFDVIDVNRLGSFKGSWQRANISWKDTYKNEDNIRDNIQDVFK